MPKQKRKTKKSRKKYTSFRDGWAEVCLPKKGSKERVEKGQKNRRIKTIPLRKIYRTNSVALLLSLRLDAAHELTLSNSSLIEL